MDITIPRQLPDAEIIMQDGYAAEAVIVGLKTVTYLSVSLSPSVFLFVYLWKQQIMEWIVLSGMH